MLDHADQYRQEPLKRSLETMREYILGMQSARCKDSSNMSQEIESRIRAALRPVAPSEDFSQKLLARVIADQPARPKPRRLALRKTRGH